MLSEVLLFMVLPPWLVAGTDNPEFFTDERCYITELLNCDESPDVSVAIARVEPGVTTQLHHLNGVAETYVIMRGTGVVEVNYQQSPVSAGDKVLIASGAPQRISNSGDVDLEFYCICTPRFRPSCYVSLEAEKS